MSKPIFSTSENHSRHEESKNLKQDQQSSENLFNDTSTTPIEIDNDTNKPKPRRRRRKGKQHEMDKTPLSDDSKQRAQILLEMLTKAIENRSEKLQHNHPHSSFLGLEHYKDDSNLSQRSSMASPDPFTDKLPPKIHRRSPSLNKKPTPSETV